LRCIGRPGNFPDPGPLSSGTKAVSIRWDFSLKSRSSKRRRREFEYAIPTLDAEELMSLRRSCIIEKVRHVVPWGNLNWEVDVFSGENQGLVLAEIELPDENHQLELPPWIGSEVTGQDQYYNGTLAQHPYRSWLHRDAAVASE
jgi:adenylate cyclase